MGERYVIFNRINYAFFVFARLSSKLIATNEILRSNLGFKNRVNLSGRVKAYIKPASHAAI